MKEVFFSKHIPNNSTEEVSKQIRTRIDAEIKNKKYEGEIEKWDELIESIDLMNEYIEEKFNELNLTNYTPIPAENVHITTQKNPLSVGWHTYKNKQVFIDSNLSKQNTYAALLHEMIHITSFHKYLITLDEKTHKFEINPYRIGYESQNPTKSEISLKALNEAITVMIQLEIFNERHLQDINEKFNFNMQEGIIIKDTICNQILNTILNRVSEYKQVDTTITKKQFEKGMFTGEILSVLRDIKNTFGKGSLKMLNKWQQSNQINFKDIISINREVLEYFQQSS